VKVGVVRNPLSGQRARAKFWPAMRQALQDRFDNVKIHETSGGGDAARLAAALCDSGYDLVIAVGGDGTIGETIDGILRSGHPATAFSFIRSGSGSDFARNFSLPDSAQAIAREIAEAPLRRIDVGRLTCSDENGMRIERHFANIASLGLSGRVVQVVNRQRRGGLISGEARFLLYSAIETLRYSARPVSVTIDGEEVFRGPVTLVACANGGWFGGGMHVAPHADLADGLLDVVIVGAAPRLKLLALLNTLYTAAHVGNPLVSIFRGRRIEVVPIDSAQPLPIDCDGEAPGQIPACFEIVPQGLNLKI